MVQDFLHQQFLLGPEGSWTELRVWLWGGSRVELTGVQDLGFRGVGSRVKSKA